MEQNEKIKFNFKIGDLTLAAKIKPEEKEIYQQAKELIEKKYKAYSSKIPDNIPDKDLKVIKMIIIDFAVHIARLKLTNIDFDLLQELNDIIDKIEQKLYPHQQEGETQHQLV